jgi:ankyrin repeat protein
MRERERENMERQRQRAKQFGLSMGTETLDEQAMEADLKHIYKGGKIDPVHIVRAVEEKSLAMVSCLINKGIDVTVNNNAALVTAAQRGYHLIVEKLVKHCDPTVPDNLALRWACHNGHASVVVILLKCRGVNPTCNQNEPLALAAAGGHVAVCTLLFNYGVKPDRRAYELASRKKHEPVCDLLVQYGFKTMLGVGSGIVKTTGKRRSRNDEEEGVFVMD